LRTTLKSIWLNPLKVIGVPMRFLKSRIEN
jgi:hypothetical protein